MTAIVENCRFETERLSVSSWRDDSSPGWPTPALVESVIKILTPAVTVSLPPDWQGEYSPERASAWIEERQAEGTVLVVKEHRQVIGLLLLGEDLHGSKLTEIRLGYLLAESAWGRGLASELVAGFVEWCRKQPANLTIAAGVEAKNIASRRVLEKCGFVQVDASDSSTELAFQLEIS